MNERGKLIIFSGPSGVGKGTVLKKLFQRNDNLFYSISATTRKPREGEIDGKDYFFITKKQFNEYIAQDKMLEYTTYCNNLYGTPSEVVESKRNEGKHVFLEIEVTGALQVKAKCKDATMIFLLPPSVTELKNRLMGRHTESIKAIQKRLEVALSEIESATEYDYIVVNNNVDEAVDEIEQIILGNKTKTKCRAKIIREVLSN